MTDSKSRCVVEISTDTRPIVYLTIDRLSTDYRPTIDRPSTDYRPTIDRLSTDCRPLYRPLCRPISQSTLPTVNKIESPTLYLAFFKTILAALFRTFGLPLRFLPSKPSFLHDHFTTQRSDFSSFLSSLYNR